MAKKKDFSSAFGMNTIVDEIVNNNDTTIENTTHNKIEENIATSTKDDVVVNNEDLTEKTSSSNQNMSMVQTHEYNTNITTVTDVKDPNIVITYNNPMKRLTEQYQKILDLEREENNNILNGFMKRPTQAETYANTTIQVRRDLYGCICEYISDLRLTKSRVLNEIFMLGINEFIKKYNVENKK